MRDIRVIEIRDVLPVTGMAVVENITLPTLLIKGENFNNVYQVFINDVPSPSLVPVSEKELLVQVPASQEGEFLRSIMVTSNKFTKSTKQSSIECVFDPVAPGISGIERLVQNFIKIMFQSPGTFSKMGGRLLESLGRGSDAQTLTSELHLSVDRTRQQIISTQSRTTGIPLDEQLLDAQLLSSSYDRSKRSVVGTIKIRNKLGKSSAVGLGL